MASYLKNALGYENIKCLISCKANFASRLQGDHHFIKGILNTWATLHIHEPTEEESIQQEVIWDNDYIKIDRKPLVWTRWREAGITYVNDIIHATQARFLSHTEIEEKFGVSTSFLQALQIRSAIPPIWKRKLVSPANQDLRINPSIRTSDGLHMTVTGKSSKSIYYTIVKSLKPVVTSQTRWNDLFPLDQADLQDYWSSVYKNPYKVARDTILQAFQFRLIHRFIPCNVFLKNIRIKRDDKCSFCPASDTIQHFLYTCPVVQVFWKQILSWFFREADIRLDISLRSFLFGVPSGVPHERVINFILLFTKFYIYRQKLFHQASLDLTQFLKEFRLRLQVEKFITTRDNKQSLFTNWRRILTALG